MKKTITFLLLLSASFLWGAPPQYTVQLAQSGNAEALNELGVYYQREGDWNKAGQYYAQAADKGSIIACYNLAELVLKSRVIVDSKTLETVLPLYKKAAEGYYSPAKGKVGVCLDWLGRYEEAIPYYKEACFYTNDVNYPNYCNALARCYFWGKGTDVDWENAKIYFEKEMSVKGGCGSIFELGLLYFLEDNYGEAVKIWREDNARSYANAVIYHAMGHPEVKEISVKSTHNLACMYYMGLGVSQSDRIAFDYWMDAAKADFPVSQYCLGLCYCGGIGVEQNIDSAEYWFCEAAKHSRKEWGVGDHGQLFQNSTYGSLILREANYQDAQMLCSKNRKVCTFEPPVVISTPPMGLCEECEEDGCGNCEKCKDCPECEEKCNGVDPPLDKCEECVKNGCKDCEKCKDCPECKEKCNDDNPPLPGDKTCEECVKNGCKDCEKCGDCEECEEKCAPPPERCEECVKERCRDCRKCRRCKACREICRPPGHRKDILTIDVVYVKPGTFVMGCGLDKDANCAYNEKPAHEVSVDGFYIMTTEVTQELWKAVMGTNPSAFQKGDNYPVEKVSWNDCQVFVQKLNKLTGKHYDLPTEAQWEYAARGGHYVDSAEYIYAGDDEIDSVAWYKDIQSEEILMNTMPVASKKPNALGIYDMSGNVLEWCKDRMGPYSEEGQFNPEGPKEGTNYVLRGGSWKDEKEKCRVRYRYSSNPMYKMNNFGLRLVLIP